LPNEGITPQVIIGIAAGVAFIVIFAVLSSLTDQSKHEFDAKFERHRGTMELSLDMNSIENSSTAEFLAQFNRVSNLLTNCEYGYVKIFYESGSLEVALNGLDGRQNCPMAIDIIQHYKENSLAGREERFDCSVPINALENWPFLANRAAPIVADEILHYCAKISD
jgi:hypothetical protein